MRSLVIIFFVFFIPSIVNGQEIESISAELHIEAQIVQSIELITINSLTIGNIQPGQRLISINPIRDINAGFMIAVGIPGAEFRLDYLGERELTRIDGDGTLIFKYFLSGNSIEDQSSSLEFEEDNQSLRFNQDGRYFIWIGGEMSLENVIPGNYEGDFTIEIDYI